MKNFGIVTETEWIGLNLQDAQKKAEKDGFTTRIVEIDNKPLIVTHDLKQNRINFRVRGNIITQVYTG